MIFYTDGDVDCSLEDILVFLSGTDVIPLLGFDKLPTVSFNLGVLATSSTCDVQLWLPTGHNNYTAFKDAMLLSIKGNDGFGGV